MGAPARRVLLAAAVGGLVVLLGGACSGNDGATVASGADSSTSAPGSTKPMEVPPKVSDSVSQLAASVAAARQSGTADTSGLSTPFLHVRGDGKIELVLRSNDPIGAGQQSDLQVLGVEVVGTIGGSGIQVWVPAEKLAAVTGLAWVVTVSPPSYSQVGG